MIEIKSLLSRHPWRRQLMMKMRRIEHAENDVRIIDLFVDLLDLATMDFRLDFAENGRPAYHPSDLLKLFLYALT